VAEYGLNSRSQKAGLDPGSLIYVGEPRSESVRITRVDYKAGYYKAHECVNVSDCIPIEPLEAEAPEECFHWIHVEGVHDEATIQAFGEAFQLHPLLLEDIMSTDQTPKLEEYDNALFIVTKLLSFLPGNTSLQQLHSEQISIVVLENTVISFQEHMNVSFIPIRERLAHGGSNKLKKHGPDFLAYSLLDVVIDQYFVVMGNIGETMDRLEDRLLSESNQFTLRELYRLKRVVMNVRKSTWPLREVINWLHLSDTSLIQDTTQPYLKDLYDHMVQVVEQTESYREMLSGLLDVYLSNQSNRLNSVMKTLTIISTIFMPLTFICSIYGMNFEDMPELRWSYGYPSVLIVMAAITTVMILFFRKKRWL
jgi:magnesium transporter